jgi:L-ascorbate metabolism protein UlaG (beta-lactamase superfamily)
MIINNLEDILKDESKAAIWHLGHSAWAVKTKGHFLIFDYAYRTEKQDKGLSDGYINTDEIANENVYIFSSHRHSDHFAPYVLEWQEIIKNIKYIFGWKARQDDTHIRALHNKHLMIDDIEIWTLKSSDDGVAFLISVDGLYIYHGGDHAYWEEPKNIYTDEIDYIAQFSRNVDIAFMPVVQYSGNRPENLTEGAAYTMTKLNPKVMFPMHGREKGFEYYDAFRKDVEDRFEKTKIICAGNRGEMFIYK